MGNRSLFCTLLLSCLITISGCSSCPVQYKELDASKLLVNIQESFIAPKGVKYPKYYGGAYVKNNRLTVIVIGDTSNRVKRDIIDRCQGNQIVFFQCKKQADATRKILHELYLFRHNEKNLPLIKELKLKDCYLNSEKRVSIELLSFQEGTFRKKVIDSPLLDFEKTIIVEE